MALARRLAVSLVHSHSHPAAILIRSASTASVQKRKPRKEKSHSHKADLAPRSRERRDARCMLCGEAGHFAAACPNKDQFVGVHRDGARDVANQDKVKRREKERDVDAFRCWVCGSEEHKASACSMTHCSRCNKPGHLAKDCLQLKTCYTCGSVDHVNKDCPQAVSKIKCYNCGQLGHQARDCPTPDAKTCHACGEQGHIQADCPQKQQRWGTSRNGDDSVKKDRDEDRCYRCGSLDHRARNCTERSRTCYQCGQKGHVESECPQKDRLSRHSVLDEDDLNESSWKADMERSNRAPSQRFVSATSDSDDESSWKAVERSINARSRAVELEDSEDELNVPPWKADVDRSTDARFQGLRSATAAHAAAAEFEDSDSDDEMFDAEEEPRRNGRANFGDRRGGGGFERRGRGGFDARDSGHGQDRPQFDRRPARGDFEPRRGGFTDSRGGFGGRGGARGGRGGFGVRRDDDAGGYGSSERRGRPFEERGGSREFSPRRSDGFDFNNTERGEGGRGGGRGGFGGGRGGGGFGGRGGGFGGRGGSEGFGRGRGGPPGGERRKSFGLS